jgi:2-octaprenyl-6-methoxyphenol hydroxylase
VRQQSQIKTRSKAYWQSCLVATIQTEKSHQNTAYERFWPSGPFAILPVSDTHCRIVWTAPHAEAQALLALDRATFIEKLMERYGSGMGELTLVGDRFIFPARLMHACEYVRSRLALVGDAAHSCHPVGGQGLNLGIRDVGALAQVLRDAYARGEDIGSLRVLRRYERWRRWENMLSLGFTDLINLIFSNNILPLVVVRRLGLWAMEHVPILKIAALHFMAGLMGRKPTLPRKAA